MLTICQQLLNMFWGENYQNYPSYHWHFLKNKTTFFLSFCKLLTTITRQLNMKGLTTHLTIKCIVCDCWIMVLDYFIRSKHYFDLLMITMIICVNDKKNKINNIFDKCTGYVWINKIWKISELMNFNNQLITSKQAKSSLTKET